MSSSIDVICDLAPSLAVTPAILEGASAAQDRADEDRIGHEKRHVRAGAHHEGVDEGPSNDDEADGLRDRGLDIGTIQDFHKRQIYGLAFRRPRQVAVRVAEADAGLQEMMSRKSPMLDV